MPDRLFRRTHNVDDPVKMLEALLLEDTRVHIVLEVPIVDLTDHQYKSDYTAGFGTHRQTEAVAAKFLVQFRIGVFEEVLQELNPTSAYSIQPEGKEAERRGNAPCQRRTRTFPRPTLS